MSQVREELDRVEEERDLLEALIETAPLGILVLDREGVRTLKLNQRAREMLGVDFDPSLGRLGYWSLVRDAEGLPIPYEELVSSRALRGESLSKEEQILRPHGESLPVLVHAGPVRDPSGAIVGAIVIFQDITAKRDLERLREEWNAIIAHDLRQPLASIQMVLQVLVRSAELPSQVLGLLRHAQTNVDQMSRMVSDLLDVSRIEVRQLSLERTCLEPVAFLRDLIARVALQYPDNRIELRQAGEVGQLTADPARLEQVFANLVSNAVKYGTPGKPILVEIVPSADVVRFGVTNEGEGLRADQVPRLFRRFQRLGSGSARGIGLGLYITRGIVEAHGGRLWVESEPGRSTTFHVELPRRVQTDEDVR